MTEKEFDIIGHTLGVNVYHCRLSKSKRDKVLPDEFYRNYFCSGTERHNDYPFLEKLKNEGIMESWNKFDNLYFSVTKEGLLQFRSQFTEQIIKPFIDNPMSKSKQSYQEFMDRDTGLNFDEYLGIQLPRQNFNGVMWRYESTKYPGVNGEWCRRKLKANKSYKEALKKYKSELIDL